MRNPDVAAKRPADVIARWDHVIGANPCGGADQDRAIATVAGHTVYVKPATSSAGVDGWLAFSDGRLVGGFASPEAARHEAVSAALAQRKA